MAEQMEWPAIDLIWKSIDKTKEFLFPVNVKLWLKLAIVALLASFSGSNFNINVGKEQNFEQAISFINTYYSFILIGFVAMIVIVLIFILVKSLFRFVLIDSVVKKEVLIGKSISNNGSLAISYFSFLLVVNLLTLAIVAAVVLPIIQTMASAGSSLTINMFDAGYIAFAVGTIGVVIIISMLILFITDNFVIIDMYLKNMGVMKSFRRVLRLVKKEWKQVLVYMLMKIVLNIATAIITTVIALLVVLGFFIVGGLIFLIGFVIYSVVSGLAIPLIVLGVILGIALFILLIYAVVVFTLPIPVFFVNYKLDFMREMNRRNKKLFK